MNVSDGPIVILGAGAVGAGLALALCDVRLGPVVLWNRRRPRTALPRTRGLTLRVGRGLPSDLDTARLVVIAVKDAAVPEIVAALSSRSLGPRAVVAHTAGVLAAEVLSPIRGVAHGALHPLVACPNAALARRALRNAAWALDADRPAARRALATLVTALGGTTFRVNATKRATYHATAVLAANLVVGLVATAHGVARDADLAIPESALIALAHSALDAVGERGLVDGLTGPLVRGDVQTVARHLEALREPARSIYLALSASLLELAAPRLSPTSRRKVALLLDQAAAATRSGPKRRDQRRSPRKRPARRTS